MAGAGFAGASLAGAGTAGTAFAAATGTSSAGAPDPWLAGAGFSPGHTSRPSHGPKSVFGGGNAGGGDVEDGVDPVDDVAGAAVLDCDLVVATALEVAAGAERGAVPAVRVGAGAGTPAVVGVPETLGVVTVTVVVTGVFDESFEQAALSGVYSVHRMRSRESTWRTPRREAHSHFPASHC
ncbi:MAG: hypothetical protein KDB70_13720 [Mycobacterium sp.]|nr:hypothetical protein [Mycobacterium sp.]